MKTFFTLVLLVFLVWCTAEAPEGTQPNMNQTQVIQEMNQETELLPSSEDLIDDLINDVNEVIENEDTMNSETTIDKVELSTTYQNPVMEVIMDIEYDLDEEGKITEISLTSPNFDGIWRYNDWVQGTVGLTVEEASQYVISGSSYATPAFQAALKETL